jgi:hypothetical protein
MEKRKISEITKNLICGEYIGTFHVFVRNDWLLTRINSSERVKA